MQKSNISTLDLNLLVVLDALLEEGSVSRAAHRLHTTQSAVSRSLARLRAWFGEPLFVRASHGIVPTARAAALQRELRVALDAVVRAATSDPVFVPATSRRQFRIATTDYGPALLFPQLEKVLSAHAPGVGLRVEPWVADDLVRALGQGAFDLALGPTLDRPAEIRTKTLFSDEFVVIGRRGHPLLARRLTAEQLADARQLQIAPDGRVGGVVDDALAARGLARRVAFRVSTFSLAPAVVASTDLLAVVPARVAAATREAWSLTAVRPPFELPAFTLSMFWHERADADPGLRWLRASLADAIATPRRAGPIARLRLGARGKGTL